MSMFFFFIIYIIIQKVITTKINIERLILDSPHSLSSHIIK